MSDSGHFDKPAYRSYERSWKDDKEYRKEKYEIFQTLKGLEASDDQARVKREETEKTLIEVKGRLKTLATKYPGDEDVILLAELYADLVTDFEDKVNLNFDEGFELIVEDMEGLIQSLGISQVRPEQLKDHPDTDRTVRELKAKGVLPSYVRKSGNPNARPVVLYLQTHIVDRDVNQTARSKQLEKVAGVNKSQEQISRDLNAGVGDIVFLEGLPAGRLPVDRAAVDQIKGTSEWNSMSKVERVSMERAANGTLQFRGYEMTSVKEYAAHKFLPYRTTGQNVFIASAVATGLDANPTGLPVIVIGSAHEIPFPGDNRKILPISEILAAHGMDVIVVDASTSYIDRKGILDYAGSIK